MSRCVAAQRVRPTRAPGMRKHTHQPKAVPALIAVAVNVLLVTLLMRSRGASGDARNVAERLQVTIVYPNPSDGRPRDIRDTDFHQPSRVHDDGENTKSPGPPTEVFAELGISADDRDAPIELDTRELRRLCRSEPEKSNSDGDPSSVIVLRMFVMPDGRISQGTFVRSSGDDSVDLEVFKCTQTFATIKPLNVDGKPVGSWQLVSAIW